MFHRKLRTVAALATAFSLITAGAALADNVVNNIDNTVDGTLEERTITAGGSTIVGFWIEAVTTVDDATGCNASESVTITLAVPKEVTATPTSVEVKGCGDANAKNVSFTSSTAGSYTIGVASVSGGKTGSSWNTDPAKFTLKVNPATSSVVRPAVSYTLNPASPDGLDGWYTSDVTLTWTVSGTSPTLTGCVNQSILADQAKTTYSCTAKNSAGSDTQSVVIGRDASAPVIVDAGATDVPNSAGWFKAAVTNRFTATDSLSGLADATKAAFAVSTGTAEGSAVKVSSGAVSDKAGNTAASIDSAAFKIDLTAPVIPTFVGGPSDGASYPFAYVPTAPTCTSSDALSGLAGCVVTGYSAAVGSHKLTATATDNAGNTSTKTLSYTVTAWDLRGFGNPVSTTANDASSTDYRWNVMKGGRTVPLKFEVFADATTERDSTADIKSFKAVGIGCDGVGSSGELDFISDTETSTGKTSLRYDLTEGQFIQNWQTPKVTGDACYRVVMTTQDGSYLQAFFKLTK